MVSCLFFSVFLFLVGGTTAEHAHQWRNTHNAEISQNAAARNTQNFYRPETKETRSVRVRKQRLPPKASGSKRLVGALVILFLRMGRFLKLAVWPLESLIPWEEEDKPSNIPGGICWL